MPKKKQQTRVHVQFIALIAAVVFISSTVGTTTIVANFLAQQSHNSYSSADDSLTELNYGDGFECGNNIVEGTELCDDGRNNGDKLQSKCSRHCTIETIREAQCGDGKQEFGEECDDGNGDNSDACSNICKKPSCGDGIVQWSNREECDDGNFNNDDTCSNKCVLAVCGDVVVQKGAGEECDLGSGNGIAGTGCSRSCKYVKNDINDTPNEGNTGSNTPKVPLLPSSENTSPIGPIPPVKPTNSGNNNQKTVQPATAQPKDPQVEEETLRLKRETMQQQLSKSMRKANEEMEKRAQQQLENTAEPELKALVPVSKLRCFDSNGNLTADRSVCDSNQNKYLRPPQSMSEDKAREQMRMKLLGDDVAERKRSELLWTMNNAKHRLESLLNVRSATNPNNKEIRDYLGAAIDWLDRSISYFSEQPRSMEEIHHMTGPVRELLTQTSAVIKKDQHVPEKVVAIAPIMEKTENLLMKFRDTFIALAYGGVQLDQEALGYYVQAAQDYNTISVRCKADTTACAELKNVLETLKKAQDFVQNALGQNPEIYKAMEAKFGK